MWAEASWSQILLTSDFICWAGWLKMMWFPSSYPIARIVIKEGEQKEGDAFWNSVVFYYWELTFFWSWHIIGEKLSASVLGTPEIVEVTQPLCYTLLEASRCPSERTCLFGLISNCCPSWVFLKVRQGLGPQQFKSINASACTRAAFKWNRNLYSAKKWSLLSFLVWMLDASWT